MTNRELEFAISFHLVNALGWELEGLDVYVVNRPSSLQRDIRLGYIGKTTCIRLTVNDELVKDTGSDFIFQGLPTYLDYTMTLVSQAARQ